MKKLLIALLCLIPTLAFAGSNIKQNSDGSTVWDNGTVTYPVGDTGLTVTIEDVSSAATDYVVTNRPGKLKKIIIVPHGAFDSNSNAAVLDFGYTDGSTGTFSAVDSGETLTVTTGTAGLPSTLTLTTTYNLTQGGVISIHTDGGSTGANAGTVTIEIE